MQEMPVSAVVICANANAEDKNKIEIMIFFMCPPKSIIQPKTFKAKYVPPPRFIRSNKYI